MKLSNKALTTLSGLSLLLISRVNAFDVEYPEYRFRPYSELSNKQQKAAKKLGYTEESWNLPLTADIEYYDWYTLQNELDEYEDYYPTFAQNVEKLGFVDGEDNTAEDIWVSNGNNYFYFTMFTYSVPPQSFIE